MNFSNATLSLAVLTIFANIAIAQSQSLETPVPVKKTLVHKTQRLVTVDVNQQTVICSAADYSFPMLKILVPGLADVTLLDHQNFGAGAPCLTTGQACVAATPNAPVAKPEDVIQNRPGKEEVLLTIMASREELVDTANETCQITLVEEVSTTIRGKKFMHTRRSDLGVRSLSDCHAK